jgi:antitoxin (DNA-binding transcriptional repressor) of toxin-antitoxin stability system
MQSVTVQEAQNKLSEPIHRLAPGDEVVITENDQPIARLVPPTTSSVPRTIPRLGTLRGIVSSTEHFDDPLEEFKEYTE